MKKIITLALATATLFAFSSCQKESPTNTSNEGIRIITATFDNNGTKTTLNDDGKTPKWAVGDVIRVLNATSYQDVTLEAGNISEKTITFTTSLEGTLYAVYPASATTMESCGGNITFTIPAIQDGTFASANICVAKSTEEDENNKDNLIFSNATAVLKITTADDVVGVDVTATNSIAGTVSASFDGNEVNLTTSSLDKNYVSAVGSSAPSDNIFYFAVAPVETGSTDINCYKTETKGSENKSSKELQRNIIYSIDLSSLTIDNPDLTGQRGNLNGHEYVIIKCGDKNLKWATMNIGATSETEAGYYFFWGGTVGYKRSGSKWVKASDNEELSGGFSQSNALYYSGSSYTKYTGTSGDGKTTLDLADDAANANWGGSWRMPTEAEFDALKSLKRGTFASGYYFGTSDDAQIFLPAAGYGDGTDLGEDGDFGGYWSSSLYTGNPSRACYLYFEDGYATMGSYWRYEGQSVRALSE